MTCFHPLKAYQNEYGEINFPWNKDWENYPDSQLLKLPCGKCIGCLLDRANDWATRCWCQTKYYNQDDYCFITLTYNNENLPENGYLNKKDEQDFWKRLRYYNKNKKIKYFGCGEYGPKTYRPHWHFCVWGYKPKDLIFYKYNHNGDKLYKSKELQEIWGNGFVIIGELTYKSACYVSRYCTKKLFKNQLWYKDKEWNPETKSWKWKMKIDVVPECTICSKGIGLEFWNNNKENILENHGIHIKIKEKVKNKKIPKYFMKKFKETDPYKHECYTLEFGEQMQKEMEKILSKTSLTEKEYLLQQERNLLEKAEQLLKRTNFI